ncbi:MAG: YjgN family protein [Spirochaetes bacterium]|nr:YjgN family protein [Spirochaetota bacterium]
MGKIRLNFYGKGENLLWINLVNFFLILITLGLNIPWAICRYNRWYYRNLSINDKRFKFVGKGSELFPLYFVVSLLSIITLGIYIPFGYCKIMKWLASKVEIIDSDEAENFDI